MPQSLSKILVHIVFSTKSRRPFIKEPIQKELYAYMATILKGCESPAIIIGGVDDHVHILCRLSKSEKLFSVIEEVKKKSSKWIKTKGKEYEEFYWQKGYGAFSIGSSQVDDLKRYINNQKEHHSQRSFQDEYRGLLKRYDVEYNESYLWD
ncbi:MAG: IS200/IS605 family transposase [Nitrospinae bacterium]|nr:IS200/IS605 family transposase [Nitrospinota bacterium]